MQDEDLEKAFIKDPGRLLPDVYRRYSGPLFRFVVRFTANQQQAEEILHDLFVALMQGKFKNGNLKAWLFTVAKNRALNHLRKSSREVSGDVEETADETDLEARTIESNLLSQLRTVETRLPADLLATWQLRRDGHDYSSIAAQLSIPVGTVKSRFSRIVELLRKEFGYEY